MDLTMSISSLPYESNAQTVALVKQESRFETLNDRMSFDEENKEMLILETAKVSMNVKGLKPPTEISK